MQPPSGMKDPEEKFLRGVSSWDNRDLHGMGMLSGMRNLLSAATRRWCWMGCLLAVWMHGACSASGRQMPLPAPASGERLVWADEFNAGDGDPDPADWTYETGGGGWGNAEREVYCSPRTTDPPCDPVGKPNSFVGADGYLHLVARRNAAGQWTSARLVTHELQGFQYGRIEARIRIPKGQGVWPAFWMLGDDIKEHPWPACGELDIMENIGKEPGTVHGSAHGTGFAGGVLTKPFALPSRKAFGDDFHVYGLLWSPGEVQFYVDDPARVYATFTPADMPKGSVWPFDDGRYFLLLNLAMGGSWPGPPDAATPPVEEMLVDYVRVYQTTPGH